MKFNSKNKKTSQAKYKLESLQSYELISNNGTSQFRFKSKNAMKLAIEAQRFAKHLKFHISKPLNLLISIFKDICTKFLHQHNFCN